MMVLDSNGWVFHQSLHNLLDNCRLFPNAAVMADYSFQLLKMSWMNCFQFLLTEGKWDLVFTPVASTYPLIVRNLHLYIHTLFFCNYILLYSNWKCFLQFQLIEEMSHYLVLIVFHLKMSYRQIGWSEEGEDLFILFLCILLVIETSLSPL